jgi:heme-degrading monooxygenase HmoA
MERDGSVSDQGGPPFAAGQVVTVFRSRPRAGTDDVYGPLADAMLTAASAQPGFVDFATFESTDGERVSLVTFATPEAHAAWRDDPAHRAAQQRGRDELYEWYSIQVGDCRSASRWTRSDS